MKPTSSCGRFMSPTAIGHTGFTGTSLWIDDARDAYVVLLTNRVATGATADAIRDAAAGRPRRDLRAGGMSATARSAAAPAHPGRALAMLCGVFFVGRLPDGGARSGAAGAVGAHRRQPVRDGARS